MALLKMSKELQRIYGESDGDSCSSPPCQTRRPLELGHSVQPQQHEEKQLLEQLGQQMHKQLPEHLEVPKEKMRSELPSVGRGSSASRDTYLAATTMHSSSLASSSQLTAEDWEEHFAVWPLEPQLASSESASESSHPIPRIAELRQHAPGRAELPPPFSRWNSPAENGSFALSTPPSLVSVDSPSYRSASARTSSQALPSLGSTSATVAPYPLLQRTLRPSTLPWPNSTCHSQCDTPTQGMDGPLIMTPNERSPGSPFNDAMRRHQVNEEHASVLGNMGCLNKVNEAHPTLDATLKWSPKSGYYHE
mmetsp:Transcript_22294/g.42625  ORF Transcript_22294/g.42625 Transcript_22294/m.42625 type:complete len:307 (+) Transcript_22294:51-971(+)|eukprot:CAMPEP_0172668554 /NCGR_PEP_ID=MMETSP1074-20121228/9135_1 /TAXON_ID=2916 /ORGANISM="Ceratium fusus, Strain PA161109" /LENGTH=306 /DNA_ID=CAMNT_0013485217 /DNA_START=40 /DNA_END=960 /DNA_ORIENTATION=+